MSTPRGTRQIRNTTTFVHLLVRMEFMPLSVQSIRLEILLQVHAAVQASHLIAVAVEHLSRRIFEESRQADFPGLAPARVIHLGIYIGIEAILMRVCDVPGCRRLVFDEFNFDNGFDKLNYRQSNNV